MTSFSPETPDIMTVSGRFFDFLDPKPEQISIRDIAHALANTCRFAGHTRTFYSVAQHSVLVSLHCEDGRAGLLHDAAEAYLTDIPRPIKRYLPQYREIEERIQRVILERFGLDPVIPDEVKITDMRLLATEGRDICPQGWEYQLLPHPPLEMEIHPVPPATAKDQFLNRFDALFPPALCPWVRA